MSVSHSSPNGQHPSAQKNGAPTNGQANGIPSLGAKAVQAPTSCQLPDNERNLLALLLNDPEAQLRVFPKLDPKVFTDKEAMQIYCIACDFWKNHDGDPLTAKILTDILTAKSDGAKSPANGAEFALLAETVWLHLRQLPTGTRDAMKDAEELARQLATPFEFSTDEALDTQLGEVEWLWEKRIPRGFLTALVAPQDEGKSTVAQDFCRTVINGGQWPDGQVCPPYEGKLLWIDTDGNLALFHQKLKEWKMPRGRFIFPPDALQELAIDNAANWKWIEAAIEKFRPPLVVIDALSGSHSGKENDTDSMKVIMKRLHALAMKYKIAIVVIHHLNKAPFGVASYPITIDRLRGSTSISQLCRSILALSTPDPAQPEARRLDVIKLNLAKKPPAVGYVLTDSGPAWGNAPEPPKERHAADDAADFLFTALANGPRNGKEVRDEAIANGLSDYALKDARKKWDIKAVKSRTSTGEWLWQLPPEKEREA